MPTRGIADMKESEYEDVESGEWTTCAKTFDLACCDCSLVHRISWRMKGKNLQLKFLRNGPATGGMRKGLRAAKK